MSSTPGVSQASTRRKSFSVDEYILSLVGIAGTKGRLLKALKEEKAKERAL